MKVSKEISNQFYLEELAKKITNPKESFAGFDELVDLMSRGNKPVYFYNNLPRQTWTILNVILNKAKENSFLNIFLGDTNCEFYGLDFLKKLEEVATPKCTVSIVLADVPSNKTFCQWSRLTTNKQISVLCKPKYDETLNHLCFTNDAYRIEAPHPKLSENESVTDISPKRPARFGFYIPEDIEALQSIWKTKVLSNTTTIGQIATK